MIETGVTRREQLYPMIRRLREERLTFREIGEQLGISVQTAHDYYSDPRAVKVRARKARNDGVCVDCGGPTKDSGSNHPPDRCKACYVELSRTPEYRLAHPGGRERKWSDEQLLDALRAAAVDGRVTKRMYDASRGSAWPSSAAIVRKFGSWARACGNAGLRAVSVYRTDGIGAEGCMLAVIDCAAELGRPPSLNEYDRWARGGRGPSAQTVRNVVGGWRRVTAECLRRAAGEGAG